MDERSLELYYPEYGIVEAALGFVLLYYVLDLATDPLVASLSWQHPDLAPEPLTTLLAGLLWLSLLTTMVAQFRIQTEANPRRFADRAEMLSFLQRERLGDDALRYLVLTVIGGALVALTSPPFATAFPELVRWLATFRPAMPLDPLYAVWVVGFLVGFGLLARGLDRLVVGLLRERRHLAHRDG